MRLKVLASDQFRILGVIDGEGCPAEEFILDGDANTQIWRNGLVKILELVAERGLTALPHGWCHEADKERGVYEFRKGKLRLFFFKGSGRDIAVCTSGVRKDQAKADKASVNRAAERKKDYFAALSANKLEVVEDDSE